MEAIKHPSELLTIGQEIEVKILKFDRERSRVSLGLKQVGEDPWSEISHRYPSERVYLAMLPTLLTMVALLELKKVLKLSTRSEMDWTNKNVNPSKILQTGDEVEVMVWILMKSVDVSPWGINQCQANPWKHLRRPIIRMTKVVGKVKSITDFGVFMAWKADRWFNSSFRYFLGFTG